MFSGIIQQTGKMKFLHKITSSTKKSKATEAGLRILIKCNLRIFPKLSLGESVAVDGVCLTVVKKRVGGFEAEVSPESINVCKKNMFSQTDSVVNLERAMRYGDVVGGHLISGHVDGVGKIAKITVSSKFTEIVFKVPKRFIKYLVAKGCVSINGVSLTVNKVFGKKFNIMLLPHTLDNTNLNLLTVGDEINLESDLLARYIINK